MNDSLKHEQFLCHNVSRSKQAWGENRGLLSLIMARESRVNSESY